jgi:flagellar transcriptional activator FlhD
LLKSLLELRGFLSRLTTAPVKNHGKNMTACTTLESIRELNLSYILLAQRILSEDWEVGRFRLGLSQEVAGVLGRLSLSQTVQLANDAEPLCSFRRGDNAFFSSLMSRATPGSLTATHAALLLASQAMSDTLID